jgi:hypothetical protein
VARLTEAAFAEIVARGCACGSRALRFAAIVPGEIRTFLGDPLAQPRWTYEGEDFVAAVHRISCTRCGQAIFERDECPVCDAPGGAARALVREPSIAVPDRCRCGFEELVVRVLVPVTQEHDGTHAKKPEPVPAFAEPGFQPTHVSCASCKAVLAKASGCAACGS